MSFFLALAFTILSILLGNTAAADVVEQGTLAELSWTSTASYTNPFDVQLRATFTTGLKRYRFWGFYAGVSEGVHEWKIRYNLPSSGAWQYTVTSSDRQLHGKTGWIDVTPPSPDNRGFLISSGRALKWENTGEPYYIMAQTAYSLLHANVPWMQVMEWLQQNHFNQIRIDLTLGATSNGHADMWLWGGTLSAPDFSRFNVAQWDKIDAVLQEGLKRGFTFEVGSKTLQQFPAAEPNRRRYLRYLVARLGAYPHLIYMEDFEIYTPVRHRIFPVARTVTSMGRDFAKAFSSYPRTPLLGIHMRRNDTYHQGSTGVSYYHRGSTGLRARFPGQRWLTCGILHERWKMEGFGILQHRPHFNIPMYVGEGVYESTDRTVTHNIMEELDAFHMREEIIHAPRFYYRRYTHSVILSGGVGMTYGLAGDSIYQDHHGQDIPRWGTGIPPSRNGLSGAEGFKDIKRTLDYFRAKKLDINQVEPDDTRINNGFSTFSPNVLSSRLGLKRAKLAKMAGEHTYYAYNPYYTNLTIRGIPAGLSVEIFDPQTGETYQGGETSGDNVFERPSQFVGDYVLYMTDRSPLQ